MSAHRQALEAATVRIARTPWATALTMAVIGIALALPAGLHVLIDNAQRASGGWDTTARISVFLKKEVSEAKALKLAEEWRGKPGIGEVSYISPAAAFEEFRQLSGFDDALDGLPENPLPGVIVVTPRINRSDAAAAQALMDELAGRGEVELAQMDLEWLQRLYAIMDIGRRAVLFLAAVLVLGVLIIVGNTIRLMSQSYREEIEVTRLLGATDGFVRRPFLYSGLMFGLAGGLMAWLLVDITLWWLNGAVERLAALYGSPFALHGLTANVGLAVLVTGASLGLIGSWIAVNRFLKALS